MTPVFQNRFGRGNGNCLQAAVASILDLPIDAVPNFSDAEDQWFAELAKWTGDRETGVIHLSAKVPYLVVNSYGVGIWSCHGTDERHAVVMAFESSPIGDGRWQWEADIAHNPNPGSPALCELEEVLFFIPRGIFGSK